MTDWGGQRAHLGNRGLRVWPGRGVGEDGCHEIRLQRKAGARPEAQMLSHGQGTPLAGYPVG